MSDTRFSPPVTTPRSPEEETGGPAQTGARWPLPEEAFWSEEADPHWMAPGELTEPQPAVKDEKPTAKGPAAADEPPQAAEERRPRRRPKATADETAQQQPEPKQEPQPPKRKRDPYLDNVKFVLIAMVVVGHSLVPTLSADSSRALYIFIYTFHMPLFVLISGYLSRNFWNSNAKTNKLVDTFLVPYVIVEVGYALLRVSVGQKWSLTIIDPAWLNWYLLALLFWRLSTPVWKRMKYPVPVAIAIYLFAGFSQIEGDFSMDRFFGLMPFFVIGLVMQPEHFEMLNRRWIKIVSVVTVLGAAAVAIYVAPKAPLDPFYFKASFQDLGLSWYMGLALRAGLLVCALAMCFAILALVPRGETWFSDLGTRTLYCYLLHGIPVLVAKEMGWLEFPWLFGPLGVLAIASSAFALAIVLCLPETRTVFKWVLEPRLTWLYRRPSRS
ncbi:acyltransferase family protein [Nonomuraea sp. NPDC050451]|uniref:acyltransferase family protein n=1 Tax=Nonomuraea sp. NPDC050451 TaxID=3364364 RepID=UPI0037AFFD71